MFVPEVELVLVWIAVAVMLTCPLFVVGTTLGAVYTPTCASVVEGTIVPNVELPPAVPFTSHVTAVLVEIVPPVEVVVALRLTVALNSNCELRGTDAVVGAMLIDVTVAVLPLFLPHDEIPTVAPTTITMPKIFRSPVRINGSHSRQLPPLRFSRSAIPAQ